jgi:hypothetical protein
MTAKITASADGTYGSLGVGATEAFRFGADNSGQLAGFRNLLINGGFNVIQRPLPVSAPINTITYGPDRWFAYTNGAACSLDAVSKLTTDPRGWAGMRLTGAAGNTFAAIGQRIEGKNAIALNGNPSIVSFYVASSVPKTIDWNVQYPNAMDTWTATTVVSSGSFAANSTPQLVTLNVAASSNFHLGAQLNILVVGLGAGESFSISGVQWEVGSIATPFEQRPIGLELSLCQRYFEKSQLTFSAATADNVRIIQMWQFKQEKRAVPQITITNLAGAVEPQAPTIFSARLDNTQLVQSEATVAASAEL